MLDYLTKFGMMDYHYWMWVAASLFLVTVLRDMLAERSMVRTR
jgi:hypothetical protein